MRLRPHPVNYVIGTTMTTLLFVSGLLAPVWFLVGVPPAHIFMKDGA